LLKSKCSLKDPFPIEELSSLNLGSADGHRDNLVEESFVQTRSIKNFLTDQHSIIIGSFGAGKSALFRLLKSKSEHLECFLKDLIVPIEEQVQFSELKQLSAMIFSSLDEQMSYQLLWRFQICRRISEELAKESNFPETNDEKYISEFLSRSGGIGGYVSVVSQLKHLFQSVSIKLKARLSKAPIDIEVGKEATKSIKRIEINLDEVVDKISKVIHSRGYRRATVIIDKIDKFVSGEEYDTQRFFIESLLEVEDDLHSNKFISFKIFLRKDLYNRLNFESIGPDKAGDNTLKLNWGADEIRKFIALRLYHALSELKVWSIQDILGSTDLSDFSIKWYERILLADKKGGTLYKIANFRKNFSKKKRRQLSLYEKLDRTIIDKLFEHQLTHTNKSGSEESIECHDFFDTHFLDGNESCTPRYVLIFLKKLVEEANDFYSNSPNLIITPVLRNQDWVWDLFTANLVYDAYKVSKEEYLSHASKIDDKWTKCMMEMITKVEGKFDYDYEWVKNNIEFNGDDESLCSFIIFLQVIGFFEVKKHNRDIKKRKYTLPILYRDPALR